MRTLFEPKRNKVAREQQNRYANTLHFARRLITHTKPPPVVEPHPVFSLIRLYTDKINNLLTPDAAPPPQDGPTAWVNHLMFGGHAERSPADWEKIREAEDIFRRSTRGREMQGVSVTPGKDPVLCVRAGAAGTPQRPAGIQIILPFGVCIVGDTMRRPSRDPANLTCAVTWMHGLYSHITCDGAYYRTACDGEIICPAACFEFACIFGIGSLIMKNQIPFKGMTEPARPAHTTEKTTDTERTLWTNRTSKQN